MDNKMDKMDIKQIIKWISIDADLFKFYLTV